MARTCSENTKPTAAQTGLDRATSSAKLLEELRDLIFPARSGVAQAVNSALVLHYRQVGTRIRFDVLDSRRATYGEQIVSTRSGQLSVKFGSGYSRQNLFRMIKFAETFPDGETVSTLSRQLSWSHFVEIPQLKEPIQRDFYARTRKQDVTGCPVL
jgi:hypothetical protein